MLLNFLYCLALWIASPMVIYRAARFGRYRRGVRQKFLGLGDEDIWRFAQLYPPAPGRHTRTVWFHAVSVGEVNLLTGLVRAYREKHPDDRVVISASTDTGYDLAKSRFIDLPVFFFPLDFTWAVTRTIRSLRPDLLVLAELELWPNLIKTARQFGCRVAVANGRLSERSCRRYRQFSRVLAPTFSRIDWVGCQDPEYAQRFVACGARPEAITVTGSIKFDNAPSDRDCPEVHRLTRWAAVDPWHQVLLAGSTQVDDELAALNAYRRLSPEFRELRLAIAPRHRERFNEVAGMIESAGFQVRRRSTMHPAAVHWSADTVVLIDTLGELRSWWGISRIALVGGAFGDRGGQNMLEPAGYGCAVCFGPNTRNFEDIARRLVAGEGAVRLSHPDDVTAMVHKCLSEPPQADRLGLNARRVVDAHRGATSKTIDHLTHLLAAATPSPAQSPRRAA